MMPALLILLGGLAVLSAVVLVRWNDSCAWRASLIAYRLTLPQTLTTADVAAWLAHIVATTHASGLAVRTPPALGLEVTADSGGIIHTLIVPKVLTGSVLAGLRATLPAARIEEMPRLVDPTFTLAAEARLTSLLRPLAHDRASLASASILASLQPLGPGEQIALQWLFTGVPTPAPIRPGGAHSGLSSDAVRNARLKQAEPMLQAVVRLGIRANSPARAASLFGQVWGTLRSLNTPGAAIVRRCLPSSIVVRRLADLRLPFTRFPLTLNVKELAGLLAFPLGVHLPGLPRVTARQLPPHIYMPHKGAVLALSTYPGMTNRPLALQIADRLRHCWVLGPTGVGKSTLLSNLIVQDMQAGRAVVALDPKGDLITDLLDRVPESRQDDVVVLDPSATDYPVGLNVLGVGRGEAAQELAVDHLVHLMSSLWHSSWGPRTSDVLRMALLTLVSARAADGSAFTLIELPELLLNPTFRNAVTAQSSVPATVRSFWLNYEQMSDGERAQVIGPSLNKLRSFTTRTALRLLLGQSQGIRLADVFTHRRILLVSLAKGRLGSDTATLLGSLIIAGFWQATLSRVDVDEGKRHPVMVYVDEFQDVIRLPLDLADMLAQARGLGVGLTLAHQYLGQLNDQVKTAVLGTTRTQIVFQLPPEDARVMSTRFTPLMPDDLAGLSAYEVAIRPCVAGATLGPVTGRTLSLAPAVSDGTALALLSRKRFGAPRAVVEAALLERLSGPPGGSGFGRKRGPGGSR
jgi:hypothetical protein